MTAILAQVEAALPQLIGSIIIAALTWSASGVINWFKTHSPTAARPAQATQAVKRPAMLAAITPSGAADAPGARLNWAQALLQIGILQLAVNAAGVVVSVLVKLVTTTTQEYQTAFVLTQLTVGTLVAAATFLIFGLRVQRAVMWWRLSVVALGTALLTLLVNSVFATSLLILNPAAILFALIQSFVAMGLGGGVAALLRPKAAATPAPAPYAPPAQQPYYPPAQPQPYTPYTPPAGGAPTTPYGPGYPPPAPPRQP